MSTTQPEFVSLSLVFYKAECEKKKRFYQDGWFSQQIAHHARGEHSHGEFKFVFSDGSVQCFSSSERDGGTRFKAGNIVLKNPENWDEILVTRDEIAICNIYNYCIDENHKDYDWRGVIRFKLSFLNENPNLWYCTEILQAALHKENLFPRLYSIHPEDMFRIARFVFKKAVV